MIPANPFDFVDNLLSVLGSYWAGLYAGRDQVQSLAVGRQLLGQQTEQDVLEALSGLSRHTVPVFHREHWSQLRLRRSQQNADLASGLAYDQGGVYDTGEVYDRLRQQTAFAFPLPASQHSLPLLLNRFTAPSLCWQPGLDFEITAGHVVFRHDPFADARISQQPLYQDGQIVDHEASLWIHQGEQDWHTLYAQFGYAIGLRLQSSEGYRELLNAVFDLLIDGPVRQRLIAAFAIVAGVPLVRETSEQVQDLRVDGRHCLICTDRHVYRFPRDAQPTVTRGQRLQAGDTLTDTLSFHELNRGQVPECLHHLAIGPHLLSQCFFNELVFDNQAYPLQVHTDDPSGLTRVEFPLGGFPADRQQFFDELHARGVAAASQPVDPCDLTDTLHTTDQPPQYYRRGTLAHWLDRRTVRQGEPTAAHLPKTINPLQCLVQNVLRNHAYVIRLRVHGTAAGLGLHHARILQRLLPPHTALFLVLELTTPREAVTVLQLTDALTPFRMAPSCQEQPVLRDGGFTAKLLSGTCQ